MWLAIGALAWFWLAVLALAFMRGAAILNRRDEREPDEHEGGLPL